MTELEFQSLAKAGYNRIPLIAEALADLETPLSLYLKLAQRERNGTNSFLLESVVGGERFGRYSFIGLPARTLVRTRRDADGIRTEVVRDGEVVETSHANPLDFIAEFQARYRVAPRAGLPRFSGGLAGYFGYDAVRFIEKKLAHTAPVSDPLDMPDIQLLLTEEVAVIDNLAGKLYLIVHADPAAPEAYSRARQRLRELRDRLHQPVQTPVTSSSVRTETYREFARDDYLIAVRRAKEEIEAGELMQVQVGQRLVKPFRDSPLSLYRALRSVNPSPYMYFYNFGDFHVVGSSPEILVRQEPRGDERIVTIRPLAGTRPRGATPETDAALATELLADPKEIAEHVMLIDLARNDVGRIAKTGTVHVVDKMQIEKYSHVQHIVSAVEGTLKSGLSNLDILRATFPAGTLSGAPKVRAMEMIDELEPVKRGLYGGAVGYLSFTGDMDLAIAIRTGIIKSGNLYVQAAAGIVADSVPEAEWQETENKARAVLRAAERVQDGLDGDF
ncbi:anthranilate synthase component I [Robbsia sp. Bb-Pol-6]|uniref:Anthranilate synthase component 1 n=1 Tax=Robbsia betulipollinis TaxID=2981849 RepID=A0ABT3ZP62_9BURK|nr:anthranilate synthase component I [Robbsia betulipollinis]MCY0388257.1 anthranilate synthase component I [Robbsia betulipollinis]